MTSTQQSPPGDIRSACRTRSSLLVFAAVAGGFVALEIGFGIFQPFWERLRRSGQDKAAQYSAFLASPGRYDSVFVGSSLVFMGIDPAIVDELAGTRSFNAGRYHYGALNLTKAVADEVIAIKGVRTLLVAVDSWQGRSVTIERKLVDNHNYPNHFLWLSALYRGREVFFGWVRRLAAGDFVDPRRAWHDELVASQRLRRFVGIVARPHGYGEAHGDMDAEWPHYLRPTPFPEEARVVLADIADRAAAAGIKVVFMRLPEFVRTYRESPAQHEDVSRVLQSIAQPRGIHVIDLAAPGSFPHDDDALYFDMHHVNARGAAQLSRLLGERLAELKAAEQNAPRSATK